MSFAALLGNSMIRTAWLALLCLIGVGIMAAVKVTTASRATPSVLERQQSSEQKAPRISLTQGVAAISAERTEPEPEP